MKKKPRAIILKKCSKNHDLMLYCSRNMARDRCNFFFELFFALLPPSLPHLTARKVKKIFEKEKISLHFCIKNYDQMMYGSWEVIRDRRKDGRKKWNIEVGVPPEK